MYLALSFAAAVAYTTGAIFMKQSQGLSRLGPTLILFALFVLGAAFQTIAMRRSQMSIAYLLVLGLESILACVFGWLFFGEDRSVAKFLGVAAIIGGIALLHVQDAAE